MRWQYGKAECRALGIGQESERYKNGRESAEKPHDSLQYKQLDYGGQGRNRTADASLFRAALYRLSYLAIGLRKLEFSKPEIGNRKPEIVVPMLLYSPSRD